MSSKIYGSRYPHSICIIPLIQQLATCFLLTSPCSHDFLVTSLHIYNNTVYIVDLQQIKAPSLVVTKPKIHQSMWSIKNPYSVPHLLLNSVPHRGIDLLYKCVVDKKRVNKCGHPTIIPTYKIIVSVYVLDSLINCANQSGELPI